MQLNSSICMQHIGDFNYPRLADFGAAISGANKSQCQEVLEELDVSSTRKSWYFVLVSWSLHLLSHLLSFRFYEVPLYHNILKSDVIVSQNSQVDLMQDKILKTNISNELYEFPRTIINIISKKSVLSKLRNMWGMT